jgi:hypothetical protein
VTQSVLNIIPLLVSVWRICADLILRCVRQDDVNKYVGGGPSLGVFTGLADPIQQQARNFELARKEKEEEDLLRALAASLEEN